MNGIDFVADETGNRRGNDRPRRARGSLGGLLRRKLLAGGQITACPPEGRGLTKRNEESA